MFFFFVTDNKNNNILIDYLSIDFDLIIYIYIRIINNMIYDITAVKSSSDKNCNELMNTSFVMVYFCEFFFIFFLYFSCDKHIS